MKKGWELVPIIIVAVGLMLLDMGLIKLPTNLPDRLKSALLTQIAPTVEQSQKESKTIKVALDVLQALASYHTAGSLELGGWLPIDFMELSMDRVRWLENGNRYIKKYLNDEDEYFRVTAEGMTLGAKIVIKCDNDFIEKLKVWIDTNSFKESEFQYAVAKYTSDSKEGWGMILMSAPAMTARMFEPAKSESPSGPIPYIISPEERRRLLDEIGRLFGDDLRKYQQREDTSHYDTIMEAVLAIKRNIEPNTYEEVERLKY